MRRLLHVMLFIGSAIAAGCAAEESPADHRPGLSFPTEEDALRYIANRSSELGLGTAELHTGPDGKVVGLSLSGSGNAAAEQQLIDDLGGSDGIVTIGEQRIPLKDEEPSSGDVESSEQPLRNCSGSYCTEDTTIMESSFFGQKKEIGGRTKQISGVTFQEAFPKPSIVSGKWECPRGYSPIFAQPGERCYRLVTKNHLSISNRYYMYAGNGFLIEGLPEQFGAASDVNNYTVSHTEWSFRADGRVKEIDGVCTQHLSRGEGGATSSVTSAGAVPDLCRRGIF